MEKSPEVIYDELLVLRCQAGETSALEELVRRWQTRLTRFALQLTERQDVASDVVQESWLAIVRGIHRLEDPATFPKWAFRIVGNKCADWTRRRQRQRRLSGRIAVTNEATASPAPDPHEQIEGDDEVARLRRTLRRLPSDQRAMLSMHYLESMPLRDIAEVLGIPRGTVKSRLYHARETLKRELERITT